MKHIVCYSGGHSSALVAIEVVRRFGAENTILLNHDISSTVEDEDIKRFKKEVADYLGIEITYANKENFEEDTPLKIALMLGGFQFKVGRALCTYYLKTKPFYDWLETHCADKENWTIYYGFDENEGVRIERKKDVMRAMGYKVEFPLAFWKRTILSTEEIGIKKFFSSGIWKHSNCKGCLKAGKQHWYTVYILRRDIFDEALAAEEEIGHSIIKDTYLKDLVPIYESMIAKGICPNDKTNASTFWANVNTTLPEQLSLFPCDCSF